MGFLSNIVGGITGSDAAKASKDAGKLQYDAAMAGIDFQKDALAQQTALNQPYIDMGTQALPGFQQALQTPQHYTAFQNDPTGYSYLQNNPMFQAAVDYSTGNLKKGASAMGKYNSGGLVDQLFQNYLATGDQYWNNYLARGESLTGGNVNRAAMPVQLGQNAANFQGTNIANSANMVSDLTLQGANAQGAGIVGAANANAQGAGNLINLATMGLYGLSGGGAPSGGGFGNGWSGSSYGYW